MQAYVSMILCCLATTGFCMSLNQADGSLSEALAKLYENLEIIKDKIDPEELDQLQAISNEDGGGKSEQSGDQVIDDSADLSPVPTDTNMLSNSDLDGPLPVETDKPSQENSDLNPELPCNISMSEEEQNLTKDPDVNPVNKLETNPDQVGTNLEQFRTNLDQLGTTADIDPDIGDFDQAQALADIAVNKSENEFDPDLQPVPERPDEPHYPYPEHQPCPQATHTCCDMRQTVVNLHRKIPGVINNLFGSVHVLQYPTQWYTRPECSHMALLKVQFEKITPDYCPICMNSPFCGRRMLKVELELHRTQRPSGHMRMVNIGDSKTNDGFGGDSGTQDYDAELDGRHNALYLYPNDNCQRSAPFIFENALAANVTRVVFYISNHFVRIVNNQGCDEEMCSECFFALNGQNDTSPGGINQDVFIALNRVVNDTPSRRGFGVCKATLSWVCPWPIHCPIQPCSINDPPLISRIISNDSPL